MPIICSRFVETWAKANESKLQVGGHSVTKVLIEPRPGNEVMLKYLWMFKKHKAKQNRTCSHLPCLAKCSLALAGGWDGDLWMSLPSCHFMKSVRKRARAPAQFFRCELVKWYYETGLVSICQFQLPAVTFPGADCTRWDTHFFSLWFVRVLPLPKSYTEVCEGWFPPSGPIGIPSDCFWEKTD